MTGFDIWNELGNIYFKVGAFDEAIDAYNKAIELDFRIGWLYSNLGFAYAHKGQYAEAIQEYEKSIELLNTDEDKAVSWSRLGEAYRQLQQYDQAVLAYQNAVELAPQDVSFSAGLNALQEAIGQTVAETETPAAAQEVVLADSSEDEETLPVDDNDDESDLPATGAVTRLFEQELIPTAELAQPEVVSDEEPVAEAPHPVMQIVGQAPSPEPEMVAEPASPDEPVSEKSPTSVVLEREELEATTVHALLSSGIEMWRKGEHEKASETLQAALDAAGKAENKWLEALSHNALALVKTELGKLEEAIASYIQAMQLAPEKIIPWNNIGHLYTKLDRNDEAMEAFLKAIEHNPEDFVSWDGLGDIYARLGRLNDAIAAYQLGNVFGKQRRAEDSLTAYQMIIEPVIDEVIETIMESPVVETVVENMWVAEMPETTEPVTGEALAPAESVILAEESPVESLVAEEPTQAIPEAPQPAAEPASVEVLLAASDETEVQAAATVEETMTEEIIPAMAESVAVETSEPVTQEVVLAASDETAVPVAAMPEETVSEGTASAVVESVAAESAEPVAQQAEVEAVLAASDETTVPVAAMPEEAISEETAPAVAESIAAETPEPVAGTAEVAAAVDLEGTAVEETACATPVMVEEVVSPSDVAAAVEMETVSAVSTTETLAEPLAIAHELISMDASPALPESEVLPTPELNAGQAAESMPPAQAAPLPEPTDETAIPLNMVILEPQPEPEGAVLLEETIIEAQAEEIFEIASANIELGRLTSAIAAYKKVTEINPENDRAWDSLGNLYRASERYGDATVAFERAIALRPNKEVYHYHLGLVYAAEKHYEDAIGAFQKVIVLNPEYTFAHCALAGYYRKLGKEVEAQEHIEKALPKMTSEKEYDRACFAAICGNPDEAIELLKIALEKKQTSLDWVRRDPDLDFIRDDRRFKTLVARNGSWSERLSDVFSKQLAWSPNK